MIAIEVAVLIFLGVVLVVGMRAIAAPIIQAYAEKVRYKYRDMGSESETMLKQKVEYLESEVLTLKQQLNDVQATLDFVVKQNETKIEVDPVIKVSEKQK